jgi:hypothetical protein
MKINMDKANRAKINMGDIYVEIESQSSNELASVVRSIIDQRKGSSVGQSAESPAGPKNPGGRGGKRLNYNFWTDDDVLRLVSLVTDHGEHVKGVADKAVKMIRREGDNRTRVESSIRTITLCIHAYLYGYRHNGKLNNRLVTVLRKYNVRPGSGKKEQVTTSHLVSPQEA